MGKLIDETGNRHGRLLVLGRAGSRNGMAAWSCQCDCGSHIIVVGSHLRTGHSQSCGCYNKERIKMRKTTHGLVGTPEYRIWADMKNRCNNPHNQAFPFYGGRGIAVCHRWESILYFLEDMGPRPSSTHSIDRIDNDGPYSPTNCRWATKTEQARNRRSNLMLTHQGKARCAKDWAEETGLNIGTLQSRVRYGWTDERVLTTPVRPGRNQCNNLYLTHDGRTQLLIEWAEELGIKYSTLRTRITRGWSISRALSTPIQSKSLPVIR